MFSCCNIYSIYTLYKLRVRKRGRDWCLQTPWEKMSRSNEHAANTPYLQSTAQLLSITGLLLWNDRNNSIHWNLFPTLFTSLYRYCYMSCEISYSNDREWFSITKGTCSSEFLSHKIYPLCWILNQKQHCVCKVDFILPTAEFSYKMLALRQRFGYHEWMMNRSEACLDLAAVFYARGVVESHYLRMSWVSLEWAQSCTGVTWRMVITGNYLQIQNQLFCLEAFSM